MGPFSNIKGLTYYRNNDEDPFITLKEVFELLSTPNEPWLILVQDEEEEERQELEILPTDNILVTAKTEDDISQLEIYVYDESEENLYVHHDLMLPSFPLCLEWLDFPPVTSPSAQNTATSPAKQFGNYIAVGTMDPEIEIWSLDTVEAMYPDMVLGRPDKTAAHVPVPMGTGKKKRRKNKPRTASTAYHVDAVLSLSWNKTHRNLLASASADHTVKLWDLSRDPTISGEGGEGQGALRSFSIHKDKVQAVQWNDKEPTVLLTGSYDRTVRTFDTRAPESGVGALLGADVEALRWDPWEATSFYVCFIFQTSISGFIAHICFTHARSHWKMESCSTSMPERCRRMRAHHHPLASRCQPMTAKYRHWISTLMSVGALRPVERIKWLKFGISPRTLTWTSDKSVL